MSWIFRYRSRAFLRSSLCAVPIGSAAAALLIAPLIRWIDERTHWTLLGYGIEGSRAVAGCLASSLLTFIVFAFSMILLAVQIASGQLTPRITCQVLESKLIKLTLGVFVFSFTYTLAALGRIEDSVPQLPLLVSLLSSLFSIALFLYLIQNTSQAFRGGVILAQVADKTRMVIQTVYPNPFAPREGKPMLPDLNSSPLRRTITHNGRSGVLVAFDAVQLVKIAERAGGLIELVPQVGDFLATEDELFRLRGANIGPINEDGLRRCIALGPEPTLMEDPVFGVRVVVEIANKALSPAMNDPTTGVLAIEQLHHLLRLLGRRQLDIGVVRDSSQQVRLVFGTPCWEDFLALATTEIRLYGAASPSVTRRLRVMLEDLMQTLPVERSGPLVKELDLLRQTIERAFAGHEDRLIAGAGDWQASGAASTTTTRVLSSPVR